MAATITSQTVIGYSRRMANGRAVIAAANSVTVLGWVVTVRVMTSMLGGIRGMNLPSLLPRYATSRTATAAAPTATAASSASAQPDGVLRGPARPRTATSL